MASAMAKPMRHGRRLFELLEEQQEPFLLDVYLLEHGYSDRAIKADAGTAFLCWPARLRRFAGAYGFKRKRGRFLRCLLRKVVYNKVMRKAWRWERAAAIGAGGGGGGTGNGIRWRSIFEIKGNNAAVDFHRLSYSAATDEGELSPISVLEPHSDGVEEEAPSTSNFDSPPNEANESSWVCFRHAHASKLINRKRQHSYRLVEEQGIEENEEEEEDMELLSPWEKQINALADISPLIEFDLSKSGKEWTKFRHEIAEAAVEIEHIIFEESLLDLVVDCEVLFTLIK